jgi:hypothetical protein
MNQYNLEIRNRNDINMSNWQITHTVNTLTTVNNKFDILKRLNNYINSGIKRNNIFIIDKSYLFNTNYRTYFNNNSGSVEQAQNVDIEKIYNMGKIVSMECNEDIKNINILFEINKKLSSILNVHFKCRLSRRYLNNAYQILFEKELLQAIDVLIKGAEEQILDIFARRINPDYGNMQKIVQECQKVKTDKRILLKFDQAKGEYEQKFEYYFNSCARPIVGIYEEDTHSFLIVNADHIYQNGEESESQIKLNTITKNSPVLLAFTVVGVMGAVMGYLAYRNYKVNTVVDSSNFSALPADRKEALKNIIENDDNSILNVNNNKNKADNKILGLAIDTYGKLEGVTDSKKVEIEYTKNLTNI